MSHNPKGNRTVEIVSWNIDMNKILRIDREAFNLAFRGMYQSGDRE